MLPNLKNEVWKDIKGYEGFYQISNTGKVRSLDRELLKSNGVIETRKGQLMSQIKDKDGYMRVALRKIDFRITFGVHRLVAEAFIKNPSNLPEVNHKDEDKENNYVNNLEWCTAIYNINYGTAIERRTYFNKTRPILVYKNGLFIKEYQNIISLCNEMKIEQSLFNAKNIYFKYNNYVFAYKDNFDEIPIHINNENNYSKKTKYMVTYDIKGNIIKLYMDINELIEELQTTELTIRKIMDRNKLFNNMFIRSYKNYNQINNNIIVPNIIKNVIVQYDFNMNKIKEWDNANDVKRVLGFDNSEICKCLRGIRNSAYGFKWERKDKILNQED